MKRLTPRRRGIRYPKRPWARGFRKRPPGLLERVAGFAGNECRVAAVRKIPRQDLESGVYAHLGVGWEGEGPKGHRFESCQAFHSTPRREAER
jgi:hypothetical protein